MKATLCKLADIPESGSARIDFFGPEALVYRHAGQARAVIDCCTHLGGPLQLNDDKLVCAWHGAQFDAASGATLSAPAGTCARLLMLPTRIEADTLCYVYGE